MEIVATLAAAATTLLAVWLGSWLSSGSSRRDKLADLRRAAYGPILAALEAVESRLDWAQESIDQDASRYWQGAGEDAKLREADEKVFADRMLEARAKFSSDYLVLSDEFIERYSRMLREFGDPREHLPPDEHERFDASIRRARPDLVEIARRETALNRSIWRRLIDLLPKR